MLWDVLDKLILLPAIAAVVALFAGSVTHNVQLIAFGGAVLALSLVPLWRTFWTPLKIVKLRQEARKAPLPNKKLDIAPMIFRNKYTPKQTIWIMGFYAFLAGASFWLAVVSISYKHHGPLAIIVAALCCAAGIFNLGVFNKIPTQVEVNPSEIRVRKLLGSKRIFWKDVIAMEGSSALQLTTFEVYSSRTSVRFSGLLQDAGFLLQIIQSSLCGIADNDGVIAVGERPLS